MTNGHTRPNISQIARATGYSRTHVRRLLAQGRTLDNLDGVATVKIRKDVHDVKTTSTTNVQGVNPSVVDLIALKRDIQEWMQLHVQVDRLKAGREPYNPRFVFFVLGAVFFVMLAYAAVT